MSHASPPNPAVNDVWVDDAGELKYFDGHVWVPYQDLTAGPNLPPEIIIKGEDEETEEKPEGDG